VKSSIPSFTIIVSFIALSLCGISLIRFLNIQLNPSSSLSSFTIDYFWPDAGARVVEQEVTSRLEAICAGVKGIRDINSKSEKDGGSIQISLDKKADADVIRFEISTLIRQLWPGLPKGISYPQIHANRIDEKEEMPLISYAFNAPVSPFIIQKYAEDYIKPVLSQIPGIYKIEIVGASPLEWQVIYDAHKLEALQIKPDDIQKAIIQRLKKVNVGVSNESLPIVLTSGYLLSPARRAAGSEDEVGSEVLSSLPVLQLNNRIIYLSDIARVIHSEAQTQSYYRVNGLNTINIVVYAAAMQNNLTLSKKVKESVERLSVSFPPGYKLFMSYDATEYISNEIHNIGIRTIFTLIILLLFVLIVTMKLKHVLLVMVMLATNLSIAAIFYYLLRIEIHLYTLAGITVSFGLMTDNIIIMSDHIRTRGNFKAWLAILAGTLATISSLTIIFFLDEKIKTNLVDFAMVIIVNQSVSLLTALLLIPALMDKLKISKLHRRKSPHPGRWVPAFTNFYERFYIRFRRHKFIPLTILVLGFGLPVFMLPVKWEGEHWYHKVYGSTLGSEWYNNRARPLVNKVLGGSLRLFAEYVYEGSYFGSSQETNLYITANMPDGATIQQMNLLAGIMERYLLQFNHIKTFQTRISKHGTSITIFFKKGSQSGSFPYQLKNMVIAKAIELGGADWGVYGLGDGFSNSVDELIGNYGIKILGYNYDHLNALADKLKSNLKQNQRVKEVYVVPELTWFKPENDEFEVKMNETETMTSGISPDVVYASLQNLSMGSDAFTTVYFNRSSENILLISQQAKETDIWQLLRLPLLHDSTLFKFLGLCSVTKERAAPAVCKENQQYRIYLQFDYVGADRFAKKYIEKTIQNFRPHLPLGYSADPSNNYWQWQQQGKKPYWLLGLIILIIFIICAILFESLLQPIAVIMTIPIAYIGVFLTFYIYDLNFDQGGFAALVMLNGITVNAAIYILNDFNNLRKHHSGRSVSSIKMYFRAFNYKIIPILLTIVATVLGFVPFLIGDRRPFWFSLAAGTIGGLVFSLIGIFIYLPLFLRIGREELSSK
jgi:multidrug efflux pump subunit AcrB